MVGNRICLAKIQVIGGLRVKMGGKIIGWVIHKINTKLQIRMVVPQVVK